jgi:hypothetical protein
MTRRAKKHIFACIFSHGYVYHDAQKCNLENVFFKITVNHGSLVIAHLPLAMVVPAKVMKILVFYRIYFLAFRSCFENTTSCENHFLIFLPCFIGRTAGPA